MNVNIPDRLYGRLATAADAAGMKIPQLIAALLDRASAPRALEPATAPTPAPDGVDELIARADITLPARPITERDRDEAMIVAAARDGWTTNEMVLAFGDRLTRAQINRIRNKHKEAI